VVEILQLLVLNQESSGPAGRHSDELCCSAAVLNRRSELTGEHNVLIVCNDAHTH